MIRDIDKTRQKTGIDKLSMKERNELFRQFVEHGGKIKYYGYNDKNKKNGHHCKFIDLKKPKGQTHTPGDQTTLDSPDNQYQDGIAGKIKIHEQVKRNRIADLLILGFKGLTLKVTTLSGSKITQSFIKNFQEQVRWYFEEISVTLNSILEGEPAVVDQIKIMSKGVNSIFYEVLVRLTNLYDEKEFTKIAGIMSRKRIPAEIYMKSFKLFYKKLYILAQFKNVCKTYVKKAVALKGANNNITRHVVVTVNNQLNRDMDALFDDFLKKFHIIICRMAHAYYPLFSQDLNEFLGISEEDRLGYITRRENRKRVEEYYNKIVSIKLEKKTEKKEFRIPDHIKKEIPVVKNIIKKYEKDHQYDINCPIRVLSRDDFMYNAVVLLDIFDMQYSFLLSSSKTNYNIDYRDRQKINIKEDLNHSYLLFNEAWEEVKGYVDIVKELRDVQKDGRLTSYQRSVLIDTLVRKRSMSKRNTIIRVAEVMKTIEDILATIILDYDSDKRLLQNPEEILSFDSKIDRGKSSDGKRVIEAITEAYLFSAVFPFVTGDGKWDEDENTGETGIDLDGNPVEIQPKEAIKSVS
jgi:hypothetical protein